MEIISTILRRGTSWEKYQLLILNIQRVNKYNFCTFHGAKEVSLEKKHHLVSWQWIPLYIKLHHKNFLRHYLNAVDRYKLFHTQPPILPKDSTCWIRTSWFIPHRAQEIYQTSNYKRGHYVWLAHHDTAHTQLGAEHTITAPWTPNGRRAVLLTGLFIYCSVALPFLVEGLFWSLEFERYHYFTHI